MLLLSKLKGYQLQQSLPTLNSYILHVTGQIWLLHSGFAPVLGG